MSTPAATPDAFQGAAHHYAAHRPCVPGEVVARMSVPSLDSTAFSALLDMGCGTGLSTPERSPRSSRGPSRSTPDPAMLAEAPPARQPEGFERRMAAARGDRDATPNRGPLRLAVACRSFHWMNQRRLLGTLRGILEPGGGIAIIGDGSFWTGTDPWQTTVREVIQRFLGPDRRAGSGTYTPPAEPYPALLASTGFTDVQFTQIPVTRTWDVEHILGYLYSTSFSARHLYTDRLQQFEATLRADLLDSTGGSDRFVEHATFGVHTGLQER